MTDTYRDQIDVHIRALAELRAAIKEHTAALKALGASRGDRSYGAVIAAYKRNPRASHVIAEFGISYATLCRYRKRYERDNGEKLPRSVAPRGDARARGVNYRDPAPIIEAYKERLNLVSVGAMFGITRERVRQIVVRWEHATGVKLPRHKTPIKRVKWACEHCGSEHITQAHKAHKQCHVCGPFRDRGGRFNDPVLLEDWIARRKTGEPWTRLAREVGLKVNATHAVPRAIWMYLRRERREGEVVEIWRGTSTRVLERLHPMRTEGPRISSRMPKEMRPPKLPMGKASVKPNDSDRLTSAITEAVAAGLSAGELAKRLGMSRGKVIGHAWRRGISFVSNAHANSR